MSELPEWYERAGDRADRWDRIIGYVAVAFWACLIVLVLAGLFGAAFVL